MIKNCHRNIMGTVSFDGQLPGMRKPQEFIVYPMREASEVIQIQSDQRFGEINLATGRGIVSAARKHATSITLALSIARKTATEFQLADEDRQTLREWIRSTGGAHVGTGIYSDNSGAMAL